jgi:hypothetical protein
LWDTYRSTAYFSLPSGGVVRGGGGAEREDGEEQRQKGTGGLGAPCLTPPAPPKVISEALFQNWLGAHDGVDGPSSRCEDRGPQLAAKVMYFRTDLPREVRTAPFHGCQLAEVMPVETNDIKGTSHPSKPHLISVLVVWPSSDGTLGPAWTTATAQARWTWK